MIVKEKFGVPLRKVRGITLKNFYQALLSSSWPERLQAYTAIEHDLRQKHTWGAEENQWSDMKMLAGQIISIHFKRYPAQGETDFVRKYQVLIAILAAPLAKETSPFHHLTMTLLMDIYDDDDHAVRASIWDYFVSGRCNEHQPVLTNLLHCYENLMSHVTEYSDRCMA